jgi:integrase/recombinase XerD
MKLPPNLIQRSNGIYYVRVVIHGTQVWRSTGTRNQREALGQYRLILGDLGHRGPQRQRKVPTVGEWWKTYKASYSAAKRAPHRDAQMIRPFLASYQRVRLNAFTQAMALKYLLLRGQTKVEYGPAAARKIRVISTGTVSREHGFLQAFFERAVDENLIDRNPFRKLPRARFKTRERVLGHIEQEEYLKRLSPTYQRWLTFMLGTGLRLDECRKLDYWKSFNWDAKTVRVIGKFGKERDVPMPERAIEVVHQQYDMEGELWKANPQRFREVLNRAARPWNDLARRRGVWRPGRLALQPISPHALRHTFATRFLQGGGDIYVLSKILGHSSVTVTEKVYAHLLKEDLVRRSAGIDLKLPAQIIPFASGSKSVAYSPNTQKAE